MAEIPFGQLAQSRVGGSGVVASEHHHSPRLGEFVPTMVGVPFDSDQSGMAAFDEGVAANLHGDGGADLLAAADVASRSVGVQPDGSGAMRPVRARRSSRTPTRRRVSAAALIPPLVQSPLRWAR